MSNLASFADRFFETLEVYEDVEHGHSYKAYLRSAVRAFLENENQLTAHGVYLAFFDVYRISISGAVNPFADLLDVLRSYEETAASLIDKQRDHYIHSVNVFVTGLCIWEANPRLRQAFGRTIPEPAYEFAYKTTYEEFFYRWGVASLFHDVGYPVEIVGKQINRFMRMVTKVDEGESKLMVELHYKHFSELNSIREVVPKKTFTKAYYDAYDTCCYVDLLSPHDLLAHRIHLAFGCDLKLLKETIDGFAKNTAKLGIIDHGYYSALIILKWYGYAIQRAGYRPEQFYWPVVDSATAIFLHNWYRNGLTKEPFSLGPMHASDNPIAWLLILCDELQEWNREARGIITRTLTLAETVNLSLTRDYLSATYVTRKGKLPDDFCEEKIGLLRRLLALDEIFPAGVDVDNESLDSFVELTERLSGASPRPLLADLELMAIAIHARYNEHQLERNPGEPLAYPNFSDLPDDLKYSNLRQAQALYERLEAAGYALRQAGGKGALNELPDEVVEQLARVEHDDWVAERKASGWTLGPRDPEKKTTPHLVPYDELTEEIKELDRDAIRNIPELARSMHLAIYEL